MHATATLTPAAAVLPLRVCFRQEINGQIVHDAIHRRRGWADTYALRLGQTIAGFGSVAIGGPWEGEPTIFEFYILPEHRDCAFQLFDVLLEVCGARRMTVQSNNTLLTVMLHTYARDIRSESIVFRDAIRTALTQDGATLDQMTPTEETQAAIAKRQGGGEWQLRVEGAAVAKGGILFHYNVPYGDIYMEVSEAFRRRGFGSYLVQELKRVAYELGAIPCARCGTENVPSRKTLQKAGFVPYAHILSGLISSGTT